ncbi:endonuclease/exonuclease/phosphatase family protein [Nocardioides lentus]|uniref:Endonuclease/exonuclease/phosphatase family protein n=2 Tax=Nocardioides lentus TaxID=338077 RepID=A0ABN2PL49_9ACTN
MFAFTASRDFFAVVVRPGALATVGAMVRRGVVVAVLLVLLVPAAALTVLRLGDPGWVLAVQAVTFAPAALVLYALALLVLVVAALRSAGGARLLAGVVAVLVVVPLALHASWFAPQVAGAEPAAAPDAVPLRVMTSNLLRGDGDPADVVAAAREARADLVVLPEATARTTRALGRLGADEAWPHRAGRAGADIEGTLVLSADPVRDVRVLPTQLDSVAFTVERGDRDLRVLAVHPIAPYDGAAGWRRDHAAILAAVRRERPDVVLGDFNATMDHRPMRRLAAEGYRTATEVANEGWRPTWPVNGLFSLGPLPLPRSAEIDHVLVRDGTAVLGTERHLVAGTDHLALSADLRLR